MKLKQNTILITGRLAASAAVWPRSSMNGNKVIIAGRRKELLKEMAQKNPGTGAT